MVGNKLCIFFLSFFFTGRWRVITVIWAKFEIVTRIFFLINRIAKVN